jgi:3'(2'), 5'-bisphosphate nucleotidase
MSTGLPDTDLSARLVQAVQLAGQAIMSHYLAATGQWQEKADASPVTQADLAAHHVLIEQLRLITPDIPVVSEEDTDSQVLRVQHERFWLIDPLDGTKEYLSRNGEFTVNLALIERHAAVWGCVFAPALDLMYWGAKPLGAFRTSQGRTQTLQLQIKQAPAICRVIASKSHMDAATQQFIDKLGPSSLVQAGSSLKFCRIAEGMADIYPRLAPTCEWDTAAAQAVLEAAGGVVLDLQGQRMRYGKPDVLNPFFIAAGPGVTWS